VGRGGNETDGILFGDQVFAREAPVLPLDQVPAPVLETLHEIAGEDRTDWAAGYIVRRLRLTRETEMSEAEVSEALDWATQAGIVKRQARWMAPDECEAGGSRTISEPSYPSLQAMPAEEEVSCPFCYETHFVFKPGMAWVTYTVVAEALAAASA
jgi:hypothetical protein